MIAFGGNTNISKYPVENIYIKRNTEIIFKKILTKLYKISNKKNFIRKQFAIRIVKN